MATKQPPLTADGAMGTYFSTLTGLPTSECEPSNLTRPEVIASIHRSYRNAGARLLRTNTFSANTRALALPLEEVLAIVRAGYEIAVAEAKSDCRVAADIGPIYTDGDETADPTGEYCAIADAFAACGADCFLFETFAEARPLLPVFAHIKEQNPNAKIMVSFSLGPDGRSRSGIPLSRLLKDLAPCLSLLSLVGLNCGCGPTHFYAHAAVLCAWAKRRGIATAVLPNAGYPSMEHQRTVFNTSPAYFAEKTAQIAGLGVDILGGCCGTTPDHIAHLVRALDIPVSPPSLIAPAESPARVCLPNPCERKPSGEKFLIAAELDPPYGADVSKLIAASRRLKEAGVDFATVSDSPMARAKLDSVVCAAKIRRETGLEVLPHLCCRDKNVNALRATLLAARCENIHAVLAVTGDHVPEADRGYVKPVFNVSSIKLMELISRMNADVFISSPLSIGGALNPAVSNPEGELLRARRKMEAGARFFLTQPVFEEKGLELIDRIRALGAKVLVGILPLVSYRNASYMSNEVPGIHVPDQYLSRFSPDMTREEGAQTGMQIAVEIARFVRPHADGFYLMTPFNRADITCGIVEILREERLL